LIEREETGDSPHFLKAATKAVDDALPNSRTAVLPGQQHIAMYTAPDLFLHEVLAFLTGPIRTGSIR